jgi:hypothetical protein
MSYDCTNFLGQRMQAMLASTSKGFAVVQPARLIRESSVLQHCWYAASGRHLASLSMSWSSTSHLQRCTSRSITGALVPDHVDPVGLRAFPFLEATFSPSRYDLTRAGASSRDRRVHGASACLGSNSPERLTTKMFGRTHAIVTIADAIL